MAALKIVKQRAKITNVNLRKEAAGPEEGDTLATDIKVVCEGMAADKLRSICPADSGDKEGIIGAFWKPDGSPRFYGMAGVEFLAKIENADCIVGGQTFKSCKLKGFRVVKFSEGPKADVEFTIQCHPTETQVGALAEKIKDDVSISVDAKQGELALGGDEKPPKKKKEEEPGSED